MLHKAPAIKGASPLRGPWELEIVGKVQTVYSAVAWTHDIRVRHSRTCPGFPLN